MNKMAIMRIKNDNGEWEEIDALIGPPGPSNNLSIGSVSKGENASASITGDSPNQVLNLVLPKGDPGPQGDVGPKGDPGENGKDGANGIGLPLGGNKNQVLVKNSTTDYDVKWMSLLDFCHPIGEYFETSEVDFDPNIYWGGTWVEDTDGLGTIAYKQDDSDFGTLGATVGEKEHQLTTEELPNITGQLNFHGSGGIGTVLQSASGVFSPVEQIGQYDQVNKIGGAISFGYADLNFGGNQPHNNIQPSRIVKRWHRIA